MKLIIYSTIEIMNSSINGTLIPLMTDHLNPHNLSSVLLTISRSNIIHSYYEKILTKYLAPLTYYSI